MNREQQEPVKVSVLICTHNRAAILKECLASLLTQTADRSLFEVIVVDNNSTDETAAVIREFSEALDHFRYVLETETGLSHARNRAYGEAQAAWLLFVDDDARADPELVTAAIGLTAEYPYDIYGGIVIPWYKYGRPDWYRDVYVEKDLSSLKSVAVQKDPGAYAKGCLMLLRKSLLDRYGGFSTELGMSGDKIAYGEETELQSRLRKNGARLAFAPQLKIHHLVPSYKMDLNWFFLSAYALGRDNVRARGIEPSISNIILISITAAAMCILHLLWYTPRLLSKAYYFENWAIDVFRKVVKRIGTIHTLLLKKED